LVKGNGWIIHIDLGSSNLQTHKHPFETVFQTYEIILSSAHVRLMLFMFEYRETKAAIMVLWI